MDDDLDRLLDGASKWPEGCISLCAHALQTRVGAVGSIKYLALDDVCSLLRMHRGAKGVARMRAPCSTACAFGRVSAHKLTSDSRRSHLSADALDGFDQPFGGAPAAGRLPSPSAIAAPTASTSGPSLPLRRHGFNPLPARQKGSSAPTGPSATPSAAAHSAAAPSGNDRPQPAATGGTVVRAFDPLRGRAGSNAAATKTKDLPGQEELADGLAKLLQELATGAAQILSQGHCGSPSIRRCQKCTYS